MDNFTQGISKVQKRINRLEKPVWTAQRDLYKKTSMLNQYRDFVSILLNSTAISKQDIIDFFGDSQGPKIKSQQYDKTRS